MTSSSRDCPAPITLYSLGDLSRSDLRGTARQGTFECPAMQCVRVRYAALFSRAETTMQLFMWQRNIVGVAHNIMECFEVLGALDDAPHDATTFMIISPGGWRDVTQSLFTCHMRVHLQMPQKATRSGGSSLPGSRMRAVLEAGNWLRGSGMGTSKLIWASRLLPTPVSTPSGPRWTKSS